MRHKPPRLCSCAFARGLAILSLPSSGASMREKPSWPRVSPPVSQRHPSLPPLTTNHDPMLSISFLLPATLPPRWGCPSTTPILLLLLLHHCHSYHHPLPPHHHHQQQRPKAFNPLGDDARPRHAPSLPSSCSCYCHPPPRCARRTRSSSGSGRSSSSRGRISYRCMVVSICSVRRAPFCGVEEEVVAGSTVVGSSIWQ